MATGNGNRRTAFHTAEYHLFASVATHPMPSHSSTNRRRRLKSFGIAFLVLLALSAILSRLVESQRPPLQPNQHTITLAAYNSEGEKDAQRVTLTYVDIPAAQPGAPTLVLVQNALTGSDTLQPLLSELEGQARLIAPDLRSANEPGRELPSYSARAKASQLLELLDDLGVAEAHFVSYSQAAAIVLNIADIAPERVQSIELISPMGIQESELLGSHVLNDGLYNLQLGTLWALTHLTPNFGYFENKPLNLAYARYLTQTDQRDLARYLQDYPGPVLIYQGKDDALITPATVAENYRSAQAVELHIDNGGHLNILHAPERIAPMVMGFVLRAEHQGKALVQSLRQSKQFTLEGGGILMPMSANNVLLIALYMALLVLATLVSEDLTCIAAGILAANGVLGFVPATLACLLGIFLGDLLLYCLGRWLGRPALRKAPLRWFIDERDVIASSHWFRQRGATLIISSRFLPGSRMPTYIAAGVLRMPFGKFLGIFLLAAALWTPCIVGVGYITGDVVLSFLERYERYAFWILISIIFSLIFLFNTLMPLTTWKGRRIFLSKWRRLTQWEYWPIWAFYPPIIAYVLYKGIRMRGLTLFTSVNPAMPHSGFTDEPKADILRGLAAAGDALPAWTLLTKDTDAHRRLARLKAFMAQHDLSLPIVLKPNEGERGEGVAIIRSEAAALDYLERCDADVIAQRYVGGLEYGIFYYRHPDEANGHIYGITDKRFTSVTGDGTHTLEHLILGDQRAVAMQRFFRHKWSEQLDTIPPKGEKFVVAEIGTHCRGSLFLDGSHLVTPELLARIDTISKAYDGFYLGRYDIKVPSVEDLQAGRNLSILELNGITAEPTFCYDPKHSLWAAYRIFLFQWKTAFAIGAANRARGHKPSRPFTLLRLLADSRTQQTFEA